MLPRRRVVRDVEVLSDGCNIIKADRHTESFGEFEELEVDLVYRAQESYCDVVRREEHDTCTHAIDRTRLRQRDLLSDQQH